MGTVLVTVLVCLFHCFCGVEVVFWVFGLLCFQCMDCFVVWLWGCYCAFLFELPMFGGFIVFL